MYQDHEARRRTRRPFLSLHPFTNLYQWLVLSSSVLLSSFILALERDTYLRAGNSAGRSDRCRLPVNISLPLTLYSSSSTTFRRNYDQTMPYFSRCERKHFSGKSYPSASSKMESKETISRDCLKWSGANEWKDEED